MHTKILSVAAPPISLLSPRKPSTSRTNEWQPSETSSSSSSSAYYASVATSDPSSSTATLSGPTRSMRSRRPRHSVEETQAYCEAQREAIALLSLSPRTRRTGRPSSRQSQQQGSDEDSDSHNPFRAYNRLAETRSQDAAGIYQRAGARQQRPSGLVSKASRGNGQWQAPPPVQSTSATSRPTPAHMRSRATPPPSSNASDMTPDSPRSLVATSESPRPRRRAKSLERAMAGLGWYWSSDAESIWGQPRASSNDSRRASIERERSRTAPLPRTDLSKPYSTLYEEQGEEEGEPSRASTSSTSQSSFLAAYAAGDFDIHEAGSRVEDRDRESFSTGDCAFPAPVPVWEAARKRAACRLGVWSLPKSVLRDIDDVRSGLAEKLGADKEEIMADILFGEEGWKFTLEGLLHHNNLRRNTVCAHVILNRNQGLTVDVRNDWRFQKTRILSRIHTVSGFPITSATGLPIGGICLAARTSRPTITEEEKESVRGAGEEISRLLEANFTASFHVKMARLAAMYSEMTSGPFSLQNVRLPRLDLESGQVEAAQHGHYFAMGDTSGLSLDQYCHRIADAMKLDTVFFAALLSHSDSEQSPARRNSQSEPSHRLAVLGKSGSVCPVDQQSVDTLLRAFDSGNDEGCLILQNEFDPERRHHLPRPADMGGSDFFSCAIVLPLSIEAPSRLVRRSTDSAPASPRSLGGVAEQQPHFSQHQVVKMIAFAASRDERHVLGVEDVRFLQYLGPVLQSNLAACIRSSPSSRSSEVGVISSSPSHSSRSTPSIGGGGGGEQPSFRSTQMSRGVDSSRSRALRSSTSSGSRGYSRSGSGSVGASASLRNATGAATESVPYSGVRSLDYGVRGNVNSSAATANPSGSGSASTTGLPLAPSLSIHSRGEMPISYDLEHESEYGSSTSPSPSGLVGGVPISTTSSGAERSMGRRSHALAQPLHLLANATRLVQATGRKGMAMGLTASRSGYDLARHASGASANSASSAGASAGAGGGGGEGIVNGGSILGGRRGSSVPFPSSNTVIAEDTEGKGYGAGFGGGGGGGGGGGKRRASTAPGMGVGGRV
ncbi:hypothetical protein BCV69DRAFT_282885 [Microstroma glucosiphilum]|uniref:GAF domain-containing protein n=1 Tax=Pseudomicrostroma glucosiphilum TaxID=1684307 RepID=A0A316U5Z7_9BASI|nr:hypothetical protein BCV69DRAFT_282885 [Pseudomicrostroma glucosiphilum]PWN20666.1 hypothetical protein BCV69DRAFT_282885 [Pseudomicrostroma glucosiphilum]